MPKFYRFSLLACTLIALLQGCSIAPKTVDPVEKQLTLERYTHCVQRFEAKSAQVCEGHRRDVIAIYPEHMQNHVSTLLSTKFSDAPSRSVISSNADINGIAIKLRSAVASIEAREVDL